ncbi:unannotated protein [freshwater metagenome]|uniref:Unannotated protein n=1 Tax=freshwater metagenome TaxID=449393 RepID=A0A6J7T1D1_9ZZZZ|nr:DUF885 family protein [Actinomycetota bacterium]MTB08676.1 DUF885 family protein [Actinomycetota bacterium]
MSYRSEIFELSDTYIDQSAAMSPMSCTYLGKDVNQDKLDDFSIVGMAKAATLTREVLKRLQALTPIDEIDRIAKTVMEERLSSSLALHDSQEEHVLWNVLTSPPSNIRSIFELMPKKSEKDFANIALRLIAVETAHKQWISTISEVAKSGKTTAQRQVRGVITQLESYANGGYSQMCKNFDPDGQYPAIHSAAQVAEKSSAQTAAYLKNEYMAIANPNDAVGADRYAVWSRYFTGAKLDLRATYEWGMADLKAINERMWVLAEQIKPGAKSLREVADVLDHDPKYVIKGKENVIKFLQDFTDTAMKRMDGEFFEIDERIKICEARLAPEGSASAPYYNGPSEDLSRPGTTWIPMLGKDEVSSWHLVSTWYHEAVPGHHLQIATVTIEKERLTRFQRTAAWISGYGEGWALYAERFMNELGAFDEPGIEMGYLSAQALRAARIVVDIGMHLGYTDFDGNVWNAESSRKLLNEQALLDEAHSRSETDRYLGWPGQAISYKVGERVWMAAREDARRRLGSAFNMKKFHTYALKIGPMGLDPFAAEMALWDGH